MAINDPLFPLAPKMTRITPTEARDLWCGEWQPEPLTVEKLKRAVDALDNMDVMYDPMPMIGPKLVEFKASTPREFKITSVEVNGYDFVPDDVKWDELKRWTRRGATDLDVAEFERQSAISAKAHLDRQRELRTCDCDLCIANGLGPVLSAAEVRAKSRYADFDAVARAIQDISAETKEYMRKQLEASGVIPKPGFDWSLGNAEKAIPPANKARCDCPACQARPPSDDDEMPEDAPHNPFREFPLTKRLGAYSAQFE